MQDRRKVGRLEGRFLLGSVTVNPLRPYGAALAGAMSFMALVESIYDWL